MQKCFTASCTVNYSNGTNWRRSCATLDYIEIIQSRDQNEQRLDNFLGVNMLLLLLAVLFLGIKSATALLLLLQQYMLSVKFCLMVCLDFRISFEILELRQL